MSDQEERVPGFQGLLAEGKTPQEAWQIIHDASQRPDIQAVFAEMESTQEGREALDYFRADWAKRGFPPPWEPPKDAPK